MNKRKEVERLASLKKSQITDEKFFTSKQTGKVISDMIKGILLKYKAEKRIKTKILWAAPSITGYTDHREICLNANCSIFDGLSRKGKWLALKGMALHEVSHVLYTNNTYFLSVMKGLNEGKLLPHPSKEITMFDLKSKDFQKLYKQIWNSLEDGYIEYRFLDEFSYRLYRTCLKLLRKIHLKSFKSLQEMKEEEKCEEEKLLTILNLLLAYCKYGKMIAKKEEWKDERVQVLIDLMPYINEYNENDDIHERYRALNEIIVLLEPLISDYLKALEENKTDMSNLRDNTGDADSAESNSQSSGAATQQSQKTTADKAPTKPSSIKSQSSSKEDFDDDNKEDNSDSGNEENNSEDTKESKETEEENSDENKGSSDENDDNENNDSSNSDNDSSDDDTSNDGNDTGNEDNSLDNDENTSSGNDDSDEETEEESDEETEENLGFDEEDSNSDKDDDNGDSASGESEDDDFDDDASDTDGNSDNTEDADTSSNENNDLGLKDKSFEEAVGDGDGEKTIEDIEAEMSDDLESEMDRLSEKMAEEEAEEELEEEHLRELKDFDRELDYGQIHRNVNCTINRVTSVSDSIKETYENVGKEPERVGKTTSRLLKQILKDRRTGGVQKGLYFGKSIASSSYSRHDKRFFQNKKLPTESPTLAVALVVDESGSMMGDRISYARFMAITTYTFCKEVGADIMIMGHSTDFYDNPEIFQYVDFGGCYDNNDKYRLLNIQARCCNRDGYALKYAVERINRTNADMKLVIIVSDGQPNNRGYQGQVAFDDLRHIKSDAKKNGIDVIAAAIGDDKDIIKGIYGDGFINISDLKKLPQAITNTIKKYLPQQ